MNGLDIIREVLGLKPDASAIEIINGLEPVGRKNLQILQQRLGLYCLTEVGEIQGLVMLMAAGTGPELKQLVAKHPHEVAMERIHRKQPQQPRWYLADLAEEENRDRRLRYRECVKAVSSDEMQAVAVRLLKTDAPVDADALAAQAKSDSLDRCCGALAKRVESGDGAEILPAEIRRLERFAAAAGVPVAEALSRAKLTNHWAVHVLAGRD